MCFFIARGTIWLLSDHNFGYDFLGPLQRHRQRNDWQTFDLPKICHDDRLRLDLVLRLVYFPTARFIEVARWLGSLQYGLHARNVSFCRKFLQQKPITFPFFLDLQLFFRWSYQQYEQQILYPFRDHVFLRISNHDHRRMLLFHS